MIEFEWDEENRGHIARHGVTVEEVEYVLSHRTLDFGMQDGYDEERFAEAGMTPSGRLLFVVTTMRGEKTRVVTAFEARKAHRELYMLTR